MHRIPPSLPMVAAEARDERTADRGTLWRRPGHEPVLDHLAPGSHGSASPPPAKAACAGSAAEVNRV